MLSSTKRIQRLYCTQFRSFARNIGCTHVTIYSSNLSAGKSAYKKAPDTENAFPDTGDSFANMTEMRVKEFEQNSEKKVVQDRGLYEVRDLAKEVEDGDKAVKEALEKDNELYKGRKNKKGKEIVIT